MVRAAKKMTEASSHFYLALHTLHFKLETLVDLVGRAGARPGLSIVVCCSTRDELDSVCSAVSNISYISVSSLYSDQSEAERAMILEKFRQTTTRWHPNPILQPEEESESCKEEPKSQLIVVTDACLPLLTSGESSIAARILINYELPTKKETYMRRMVSCLAGDGIVVNMVVGGEVVTLKSIEESTSLLIAEMPIDIFEML